MRSDDGEVALARDGRNYYLAGQADDALLATVLRRLASEASLEIIDLPESIRIRDNGDARFVFNYGRDAEDISAIIGGAALLMGERLLEPCGVAAFAREPG
jgi:beta-galactosidase